MLFCRQLGLLCRSHPGPSSPKAVGHSISLESLLVLRAAPVPRAAKRFISVGTESVILFKATLSET